MSFIELPLGDTQEAQVVPEGVYNLLVEDAQDHKNAESGRESIMCMIRIEDPPEDVPNPATVFHFLVLPTADDDEKTRTFVMLEIKRFLEVFDIPYEANGFSSEDIPGATADVLVTEGEYEGRPTNSLRLPAIEG